MQVGGRVLDLCRSSTTARNITRQRIALLIMFCRYQRFKKSKSSPLYINTCVRFGRLAKSAKVASYIPGIAHIMSLTRPRPARLEAIPSVMVLGKPGILCFRNVECRYMSSNRVSAHAAGSVYPWSALQALLSRKPNPRAKRAQPCVLKPDWA